MPGLDQVEYLTNSSILELDALPPHLVIIGGSYVGLEFGQVFRRFGSQVTIIEMAPRLIAREDEDVSMGVADVLEAEGIALRLNATCLAAKKHPDLVPYSELPEDKKAYDRDTAMGTLKLILALGYTIVSPCAG